MAVFDLAIVMAGGADKEGVNTLYKIAQEHFRVSLSFLFLHPFIMQMLCVSKQISFSFALRISYFSFGQGYTEKWFHI